MKKTLSLILAVSMAIGLASIGSAESAATPRDESLYFAGLAWGPPTNFNPVTGSPSWPVADHNVTMFEPLYMYNMLDNSSEPLLAAGSPEWEDDYNFLVTIKDAAKWNDGAPLTNEDVAYTFNFSNRYTTNWSNVWVYLEKVEAVDGNTVRFTLKESPYNRLQIMGSFNTTKILPKHVWEAREAETGGDLEQLRAFTDLDAVVSSGAYMPFYYDDTRIIAVRNDDYWGQDASMFGKLPAPKYLIHQIFSDNAAGNLAMKEGNLDVSQQFIPNVWELWEDGSPISTYLSENPYYLPGSMPSIVFNMTVPGLDDPVVRRAIALSVDYEAVAEDAMCGMTDQVVPSIVLNTFQDALMNQSDLVDELRWDTADVDFNRETANALLDEAGYLDVDGDGFREMPDGSKIEWKVECPYGWSDWNASLEIVSKSAQAIGLNLVTYFPEAPVYDNDRFYGTFDIIMQSPHGALSAAAPWSGVRNVLYSGGNAEIGAMSSWNNGRYANARVDALIDAIAAETDIEKIKAFYTELDELFLTDLPTFPLMYRPWQFHTVSEHVWKGFPTRDDGSHIPPNVACFGAGVRALYAIELVN